MSDVNEKNFSNDSLTAGAGLGIAGGGAGRLPAVGAAAAVNTRGTSGGTGIGAVASRVDAPQWGHGMVSPAALMGNSRCPPHERQDPFAKSFSPALARSRKRIGPAAAGRRASPASILSAAVSTLGAAAGIGEITGGAETVAASGR